MSKLQQLCSGALWHAAQNKGKVVLPSFLINSLKPAERNKCTSSMHKVCCRKERGPPEVLPAFMHRVTSPSPG